MCLTFSFVIFLMATSIPEALCWAIKTFPKAPYPLHFPRLKSFSDILSFFRDLSVLLLKLDDIY